MILVSHRFLRFTQKFDLKNLLLICVICEPFFSHRNSLLITQQSKLPGRKTLLFLRSMVFLLSWLMLCLLHDAELPNPKLHFSKISDQPHTLHKSQYLLNMPWDKIYFGKQASKVWHYTCI